MGEILVDGLGLVEITGDVPTEQETKAIREAIMGKPRDLAGPKVATQMVSPESAIPLEQRSSLAEDLRPELTKATRGYVSRPAFEAAGATAGGLVGGGAGIATGPAAPAASPAGMVAGAALGAGAGSAAFDVAETGYRALTGKPQRNEDILDPSRRALQAATTEAKWTAGAASLGPVLKAFKPLAAKALGIGEESAKVAREARGMGVPLGILQASESKPVKGVSRVLGVFPFVGGPIKKGAVASQEALTSRYEDILNTLAPNATIADLGVDLTKAASGRYDKFKRVAGALYGRFNDLADNATVKDIIPTTKVREMAAGLAEETSKGSIVLRTGKTLAPPLDDPLTAFLGQINSLPERLTARQARELQRGLGELAGTLQREGRDMSRVIQIKKALEADLNSPLVDLLPEAEGRKIVDSLTNANAFYAENIKRFETTTANKFGRVDRNMFKAGAFKAGSVNEDEIYRSVFNARSPQAVADLRSLVGPTQFQSASRKFLADSFDQALATPKGKGLSFDADKFADSIGLNSEDGRRALGMMLGGSGTTIKDLRAFVDVARAAGSVVIPDTSVFLQRRLTLGGLATIASATATPTGTMVAILMGRYGAKILSNPESLRALTIAMKDTVPDQQRRALVLRVARQFMEEDTYPPTQEIMQEIQR